ncbi:type II toxin-antitoxin system RelE/ParE family toxin [Collinsella sp. An307]|nr:type II toxin-antitoxin system RelE/ParE family toxin [Collinsella sp. An307]
MGSRAVAICSSIRVNRQWRLCFQWNGEEAVEVEFVDYHG